MSFDLFIGIDYSGAEAATSRLKGLQVYTARPGQEPEKQYSPAVSNNGQRCNWSRKEVAQWLIGLAHQKVRYLAGIDHGFSFPQAYFDRYQLTTWVQFLDDFVRHWPTDQDHTYVDFCRDDIPQPWPQLARAWIARWHGARVPAVRAVDVVGQERFPVRRAGPGGQIDACRHPVAEANPGGRG